MTISAARRTRDNPIARVAYHAAGTSLASPAARPSDCYDVGNISTMTQDDGTVWDYDYDGRYRLTSAARDNAAQSPTISAAYTYAYDDGDNLLSKTEPFLEDFEDENMTGWTQSGYTASNRYAQRTAVDSGWPRFERSQTDADVDLRFSYACGDTSDTTYRMYTFARRLDTDNWLALFLFPDRARLAQKINGGSYQYLDTETIATTEDAWYDVRVVADGANVTVWRGEKGGAMEKILETSSASITTTSYLRFENAPYSDYRVDDITLVGGSLANITTAFTYDSGNELSTRTLNSVTTSFTYDAWGRMASKYVIDGVSASYAYRYGDKLYSVTSYFPGESNVSYDYGGDQKRRERTAGGTTVKYNWDLGWNLLNQETSAGTLAESYVVQNPNAEVSTLLGMVSGSNPSTGTYAYFAHDHLGSVRGVYDASKALTGHYAYTPYGSMYAQAGATAITDLPAAFTGKPLEPASGLYSFPYRMYSPDLARWLSRDPLGMVDGPNVYGYVASTPQGATDPLGAQGWPPFSLPGGEPNNYEQNAVDAAAARERCLQAVPAMVEMIRYTMQIQQEIAVSLLGTPTNTWGFSPWQGRIVIDPSLCEDIEAGAWSGASTGWVEVAHEVGHAVDDFSRWRYVWHTYIWGDPYATSHNISAEISANAFATEALMRVQKMMRNILVMMEMLSRLSL